MLHEKQKPNMPERIPRLNEIAYNLWWSWHPAGRELFRELDYQLWVLSAHNPVKQLQWIKYYRLEAAAKDPKFLKLYDAVIAEFDADMSAQETWLSAKHPNKLKRPIAFFSAEFAIHNALPIYAGGLGVLAGDICKEASDLGLPFVCVGFMYPHGYFHQHISVDGWQEEVYKLINFDEAPIELAKDAQGHPIQVKIQLGDRKVSVGVWHVGVGRVNMYLLDTDIDDNTPPDRALASQLYVSDQELRIQQEIILGVGGVRVLRLLGKDPVVWHANEGHTAFMMAERVREEVEAGSALDEAVKRVKSKTVFTTHTPVPAGHDVFPIHLVEKYFSGYWEPLGVKKETFFVLGRDEATGGRAFNMTAFALRMAGKTNGVSKLHGGIARKMWRGLYPDLREEEVPISHVTNGVHVPTWIAQEMGDLYDKYLGHDWVKRQDDPEMWQRVRDIPDEEFWAARQNLKRKLLGAMRGRSQDRWASGGAEAQQLLLMGVLFHPEVLTIGFLRRFAEYKRPDLVLKDVERLKHIVSNYWRPVQIVFAGKSHPADANAKRLLQRVYKLAADRGFQGRIAFVEDYDMHMAHYLVQGVDVWLNNPRRLQEACGTSGMKAAINGSLHCSVRDGWWYEAYDNKNGWAIGGGPERAYSGEEDKEDAESIYSLLEDEIIPLYYSRDRDGMPRKWIVKSKDSICTIAPQFCARRMLKEYTDSVYIPSAQSK